MSTPTDRPPPQVRAASRLKTVNEITLPGQVPFLPFDTSVLQPTLPVDPNIVLASPNAVLINPDFVLADQLFVPDFVLPFNWLIPRAKCTMPVSPVPVIEPATMLESPDPSDGKRHYLPVFRIAEQDIDGERSLRVRLRRDDAGWRLDVGLTRSPRAGGTDPLPITITPVITYQTPSAERELVLQMTQESQDVFSATLLLPNSGDGQELYHAMTTFEWGCKLVLRCRFDAAVPVPGSDSGEGTMYRQGSRTTDVPIDHAGGQFVFLPNLHPDVFKGVVNVGSGNFDLITRTVSWRSRTHHYYQEESKPHLFRYLPDGLYLMRTGQPPYAPSLRVRFESPDGSRVAMRALVEYAVAPVVDPRRLRDAQEQLRRHLPSQLPDGVNGPDLQPLMVTDPDKLRFEITVPRAGGAGSTAQERPGVVKNLTDAFSDQISDLTIDGFREIFDALFGTSAVVFSGSLHVGEQGSRPATSIPFIARLKDLAGPVFAVEQTQAGDGVLQITVTNASESPLVVNSLPVQLVEMGTRRVAAARLEDIAAAGAPAAFPIELPAGQGFTARVLADDREAAPILRRGSEGSAVRVLQRALAKAGQPVDVDGDFGPQTEAAVRGFQQAKGLDVNGVADPPTNVALGIRGRRVRLTSPVEGLYDLREIDERPDPDAVWTAIFDATVPAEYTRPIKVVALEEWFKPHTDVSAIAIDFENGGQAVMRPGQLEADVLIRVPVKDLILRNQQDSEYRYTQITIRGSQQTREEKSDTLDILFPVPELMPVRPGEQNR